MHTIVKNFEKMGARAKIEEVPRITKDRWGRQVQQRVRFDIGRDKNGPFYDIITIPEAELTVLDVQAKDRHLLVMTRVFSEETGEYEKSKFLCGHDERDWFIARTPDNRPVSNVATAKESLKPEIVISAQESKQLGTRKKNRRHNKAFIRQGEWFFIPAPNINPSKWSVIENEPLIRGRGKPHTAEYVYRIGGTNVYVSQQYPNGLSETEYRRLLKKDGISASSFRVRRLDPQVYAKGRITHADHKTVTLNGWHRVIPNTEPTVDRTGRQVVMGFID